MRKRVGARCSYIRQKFRDEGTGNACWTEGKLN